MRRTFRTGTTASPGTSRRRATARTCPRRRSGRSSPPPRAACTGWAADRTRGGLRMARHDAHWQRIHAHLEKWAAELDRAKVAAEKEVAKVQTQYYERVADV